MQKHLNILYLALLVSINLSAQENFPKNQLDAFIKSKIEKTNTTFDWKDASVDQLWISLMAHDSVVAIGYKPVGINNVKPYLDLNELDGKLWEEQRNKLIDHIERRTSEIHDNRYSSSYLFPYGKDDILPHFIVRITDVIILDELRQMEAVRYIDPMTYKFDDEILKSNSGCGSNMYPIDPNDYQNIPSNPSGINSVQSWHHDSLNVNCVWDTYPKQGDGIGIAVFDSGISAVNSVFSTSGFSNGMSSGRSIIKKSFFPTVNSSTDDLCGHGTAMAGLAAAPRGTATNPAGVAYRSNLYTYRVVEDVIINTTDENNAVKNGLLDAASNSNIHIISMSLGNIINNGLVEDGIIAAYNADKLILCAAGTSTCFTNWYPVIFPAKLPETVAITGVIENTNFSPCCTCHDGNEVDFVVIMERQINDTLTAVTTAETDANMSGFKEYVGGSSSATATMAGAAALAWSNNASFSKNQLLSKLITSSSNYPSRDNTFGWGTIDVCLASSPAPPPCNSELANNNVTMEILSITFPALNDGFGSENEWVITLADSSYYFRVDEGGVMMGNPVTYLDPSVCSSVVPIIVNLGNSVCGQNNFPILIETHEDDSFFANCVCNGGDDHCSSNIENVMIGSNTFTHTSGAGTFIFEYVLTCSPDIFVAGLSDDSPACPGELIEFIASPIGEAQYDFFIDVNNNGELDPTETILQSGTNHIYTDASLTSGSVLGVQVTREDASGNLICTDISTAAPVISPLSYSGMYMLTGNQGGVADYEANGIIESNQIIDNTGQVDYDSQVSIELLPNFEVQLGALFEAFIDGCNGGAGGVNTLESSTEVNTSK